MADPPTRAAAFAAAELRHHVERMTGVALPIRRLAGGSEEAGDDGAWILVGESAATAALGLHVSDFGPQEYLIRFHQADRSDPSDRSYLILMGRDKQDFGELDYAAPGTFPDFFDEQGTCYAVYDFLERVCGVRWFNPTDYGVVCPRTRTLTVAGPDVRRSPHFKMRGAGNPTYYGMGYEHGVGSLWDTKSPGYTQYVQKAHAPLPGEPGSWHVSHTKATRNISLFQRRMRLGGERQLCNHSMAGYYGLYGKSHPDWFAQGQPFNAGSQLCYTHTGVVARVAADARAYYDGAIGKDLGIFWNPRLPNTFPIEPPDSSGMCLCDACRALRNDAIAPVPYSNNEWSDLVFGFVNRATAALQKTHPGKRTMTLAYSGHAGLPTRFALHPNVDVQFCFAHAQQPGKTFQYRHELELARAWGDEAAASGRSLYAWLYHTAWSFAINPFYQNRCEPFPPYTAHAIAAQFELFRRCNYRGMYFCGLCPEPDAYVVYKLMDDPTQDVDDLLDDYFSGLYGLAAAPMKEFYLMAERIWSDPANLPPADIPVEGLAIHWGWLGTGERMTAFSNLMARAKAVATDEPARSNVALFEIGTWEGMVAGRRQFLERFKAPDVVVVQPEPGAVCTGVVDVVVGLRPYNSTAIGVWDQNVTPGWHRVVATHDADAMESRLFIDGELRGTAGYLPAGSDNMELRIGGNWCGDSVVGAFRGAVDDLRLSPTVWHATGIPDGDGGAAIRLPLDEASELSVVSAVAHGAPLAWTEGVSGRALSFDGASTVYLPKSGFSDRAGTLDCWVNIRDEQPQGGNIVGTSGGYGFHLLTPRGRGIQYAVRTHGLQVDYLVDGQVVGTRTCWPYTSFSWTNAIPGRHELAVRVRDIYGLTTLSAPVTIRVR
ncbi:MAG: DUF4838 domain-containing protein [Kiritimatiellae bacterium]|nr:DUF4838 domain-containing protein [Kiritimatiellia bacterium]